MEKRLLTVIETTGFLLNRFLTAFGMTCLFGVIERGGSSGTLCLPELPPLSLYYYTPCDIPNVVRNQLKNFKFKTLRVTL